MSEPVIVADNVTKRYGMVLGLNGFSTRIGPGITGLIGPNGAGKSTLFRLLAGQLKVDAGDLRIFGVPAWSQGDFRRKIGYCPEHSALFEWMTARDFVSTLLRVDGFSRSEAEDRALRAIATLDLTEAQDRRLGTFSKGMRQRIKLAQSIAHDPDVLLLDEPLNGVDPLGRATVIALLRRLQAEGRQVLVSSHVLYEVERLTDNIVMIANGRALAQGDLHRIRDLIDAHPHVIDIETPDPRGVARALGSLDDVVSVEFPAPGRLRVRSRSPEQFYQALPTVVTQSHVEIEGVSSADDNLDSVFRYLSERGR